MREGGCNSGAKNGWWVSRPQIMCKIWKYQFNQKMVSENLCQKIDSRHNLTILFARPANIGRCKQLVARQTCVKRLILNTILPFFLQGQLILGDASNWWHGRVISCLCEMVWLLAATSKMWQFNRTEKMHCWDVGTFKLTIHFILFDFWRLLSNCPSE